VHLQHRRDRLADAAKPCDDHPGQRVRNPLVEKYGKTSRACKYLGKINGHWMVVLTAA
jgi:hypothetical protein